LRSVPSFGVFFVEVSAFFAAGFPTTVFAASAALLAVVTVANGFVAGATLVTAEGL
jgi:hypothetical protein